MNKEKYIKKLSEELNCDYECANKISNIIEDNFLLGKRNKEKIINQFIDELNINVEEANLIYNVSSSIISKEIKNKFKHPFRNLDKEYLNL